MARKTIFEWVIMGRYSLSDVKQECSTKSANVYNVGAVVYSDDLLRFWETEEVIVSTPIYISEEKDVIAHFNSTYHLHPVGR